MAEKSKYGGILNIIGGILLLIGGIIAITTGFILYFTYTPLLPWMPRVFPITYITESVISFIFGGLALVGGVLVMKEHEKGAFISLIIGIIGIIVVLIGVNPFLGIRNLGGYIEIIGAVFILLGGVLSQALKDNY